MLNNLLNKRWKKKNEERRKLCLISLIGYMMLMESSALFFVYPVRSIGTTIKCLNVFFFWLKNWLSEGQTKVLWDRKEMDKKKYMPNTREKMPIRRVDNVLQVSLLQSPGCLLGWFPILNAMPIGGRISNSSCAYVYFDLHAIFGSF